MPSLPSRDAGRARRMAGPGRGRTREGSLTDSHDQVHNLEENYDGEYSAYYGRSQDGKGEFFGAVVSRRSSRREAIKAGLVLGVAASAGGALSEGAGAAPAPQGVSPLP